MIAYFIVRLSNVESPTTGVIVRPVIPPDDELASLPQSNNIENSNRSHYRICFYLLIPAPHLMLSLFHNAPVTDASPTGPAHKSHEVAGKAPDVYPTLTEVARKTLL